MAKTREECTMIGLEIIAFAGDGRSKLLNALKAAEKGNFEEADKLTTEANECLVEAHKAQTELLTAEASGEDVDLGFIMVHAQDHLMTILLLRDMMGHLINFYKRTAQQ